MKKTLFLMMLLLTTASIANARVQALLQLTATSFSYRTLETNYYGYTYWTDWSSDMSCCLDIVVTNTDQIIIYSESQQIYNVLDGGDEYRDNQGNMCYSFSVRDQDGDRGTITLRLTGGGYGQLYVQFSNIMWVYEVQ